jgi:DNA-binding transcriptional ArsR family regulator
MKERSGLGSALRRRLGIPIIPSSGVRPARSFSLLMNATRLKIFQAVYNLPCSNIRQLSKRVGVAPPSVSWHLRKLSEAGIVGSTGPGRRRRFYIPGSLEEEDVPVLSFFAGEDMRAALRSLCQEPGLTQGQLIHDSGCNGHTIRALVAHGIVDVVRDGRNRRYYPGEVLARRSLVHEERARRSRQHLLSTLSREGLQPESADPVGGFLEIRLRPGGSAETLRFRRNPYELSRW